MYVYVCVCVCACDCESVYVLVSWCFEPSQLCVCVRSCVRACMHVCVRACECVRACVRARSSVCVVISVYLCGCAVGVLDNGCIIDIASSLYSIHDAIILVFPAGLLF